MRPVRVALADDHALVRSGLRSVLRLIPDLEVCGEAADGQEALELVAATRPDLVLLDISLPGLNGIEVTARLAQSHQGVKVLILSMHVSRQFALQALRAGAAGYMHKDATVADLGQAIESVMKGQRYLSPPVARLVSEAWESGLGLAADPLTPRQREVLQMLAESLGCKEIAFRLHLSVKTVEAHRAQIMDRLDIHDLPGLVRHAIRTGLVTVD